MCVVHLCREGGAQQPLGLQLEFRFNSFLLIYCAALSRGKCVEEELSRVTRWNTSSTRFTHASTNTSWRVPTREGFPGNCGAVRVVKLRSTASSKQRVSPSKLFLNKTCRCTVPSVTLQHEAHTETHPDWLLIPHIAGLLVGWRKKAQTVKL